MKIVRGGGSKTMHVRAGGDLYSPRPISPRQGHRGIRYAGRRVMRRGLFPSGSPPLLPSLSWQRDGVHDPAIPLFLIPLATDPQWQHL